MKRVHLVVGLAALSLASYAQAQVQEDRLGSPVARAVGAPRPAPAGAAALLSAADGEIDPFRLSKALDRLKPESQAVTRGANESRIYQRAAPAVVLIVSKDGLGSGALISADGRIITNLHVVEDAAEVGVVFKPAQEGAAIGKADVRRAKVLLRDEVADLALIQVQEVPAGVTPLPLGNSTTLEVGADVHAIGHPTGESWTYTRGIVSQIRRAYAWTTEDKIPHEATVIQTQTPINPGNSGGPLLDDGLNLVGVNSFVREGEGLNFAVSVEDVKSFLARGEDRMARSTTRVAAGATCEATALSEEPSKKPKGTNYVMDSDCDGKGDGLLLIPVSKREPITLFQDEDGDGNYDAMYLDFGHDGATDVALFDTDHDGKPDLRGMYRDGEDEPYLWEKLKD